LTDATHMAATAKFAHAGAARGCRQQRSWHAAVIPSFFLRLVTGLSQDYVGIRPRS